MTAAATPPDICIELCYDVVSFAVVERALGATFLLRAPVVTSESKRACEMAIILASSQTLRATLRAQVQRVRSSLRANFVSGYALRDLPQPIQDRRVTSVRELARERSD